MTLFSILFLIFIVPLSLLLYWYVIRTPSGKLGFLCLFSYLFYAFAGPIFLPLLAALSIATFVLAHRDRYKIGIILNLAALALFKYWNFGAENLNGLSHYLGIPVLIPVLNLTLPLGISFYVFKHIGYLIDVHKKRYPASGDLLAFTTYSAYFLQISAGPLSSFNDTGKQLRNLPTHLSTEQIYSGWISISVGLAKKVLIANTLSVALQSGLYSKPNQPGFLWAWISVLMFATQLYFDFSGYTDLVLGISTLFGVTLPPNFNNPYLANNPSQFWQRWHISLSQWFRLYVFTPVSRSLLNRWGFEHKERAQYTANVITMLLVGLWHGANWTFILWGGYHGLLLNLHNWFSYRKRKLPLSTFAPLLMFVVVVFGWGLFLSPTLEFAGYLFSNLSGINGLGSIASVTAAYSPIALITVLVALVVILSGISEAANLPKLRSPGYAVLFGVLCALAVLLIGRTPINFVYVQF